MTTSTRRHGRSDLERLMRSASEEMLAELAMAAYVDPLTGLFNRRALDRDVPQRLAVAKRGGRPLTVVLGDLDGLKSINDRDGHAAGDLALRTLGSALASALRAGDTAYRIGGDEFLLLLADATAEESQAVVARVTARAPAFSWGAATFPEDGDDGAGLVNLADQRLLAGRRSARGRGAKGRGETRISRPARRAPSAFAAIAVVLTALLGGVGMGFAAENVMDGRESRGEPTPDGPAAPSPDQHLGDSSEPGAGAGAPASQAESTSVRPPAAVSPVSPAPTAPEVTLPSIPVDEVEELVPPLSGLGGVVDAVEKTLRGASGAKPSVDRVAGRGWLTKNGPRGS